MLEVVLKTAITEKIESDNKSSFELLNLKYPGNWRLQDGVLYKGTIKIVVCIVD